MAKKRKPQTLHEVERGEILRYLLEVYPAGATPKALQNHLDYMRYNVSDDDLEFDLAYLDEKHFISIERFPKEVGREAETRLVKITAAGIDFLDRRKAGEPGVR